MVDLPARVLLLSFTPLYQASSLAVVPAVVQPDHPARASSRPQAGQGMLDFLGPLLLASPGRAVHVNGGVLSRT
ncbi:MAG TPA: hypothetical protein VKU39_10040 [Streptosporangiaceae bacterium]|nr:hypothetical protein [Streptosporangiaceae bacterium]